MSARARSQAPDLLTEIDETRSSLIKLVRSADQETLLCRPSAERWSVLENVRHLLFAEQVHLASRLPKPPPWSGLGLPPAGLAARFRDAYTRPSSDLHEVLRAWNRIHSATQALADHPSEEVLRALYASARHLGKHKLIIEHLLRKKA